MFTGFFSSHEDQGKLLRGIGIIITAILAHLAEMLVQLAIFQTKAYAAGRLGDEICGHPLWLGLDLERPNRLSQTTENQYAENNPATVHLFIISPLHLQSVKKISSRLTPEPLSASSF